MAHYPSALWPSADLEPLGNAGGLSGSTLWRFRAGSRSLLLRAWPVGGLSRPAIETIHAWLARAGPLGFVPVPIASNDGRALIDQDGRFWELTPWLEGAPDLGTPARPENVRGGFAALARFHQALARHRSSGPSPGLGARLAELEAWQSSGFRALGDALERTSDPHRVAARQWLDAAKAFSPGVRTRLVEASGVVIERQPCLRDARPDHLLFHEGRLTGLVDFGAMGIDTVATDLARLISEWVGIDRTEALDAYQAVRPLDPRERALIPLFEDSAALLTGGRWASWHFLERRTFSDPSAVGRGLAKGVERLGRLASPFRTTHPS